MHRPPSSLAAITEATAAVGCQLKLSHATGALVRTLAGSKTGGVFLQLGSGAPEAGAWLLDGMDITSKLVVVVDEPRLSVVINHTLGNDIRVAVHTQDTLEFLADISAHELHLILFDTEPDDIVVGAAVKLLAPGGLLLSLTSNPSKSGSPNLYDLLRRNESLQSTRVEGSLLLASRRPLITKPVRRGARRMRRRRAAQDREGI